MSVSFLVVLLVLGVLVPISPAYAQITMARSLASPIEQAAASYGVPSSPCLVPSPSDLSTSREAPSSSNGTIAGNTVPLVASGNATYKSDVPNSTMLSMELVFGLRNRDSFQQCLQTISDPTSLNYGKWLNASTLAPYLPTPGQRASVLAWLQTRGFAVTDGFSPLVLNLRASASIVKATFRIKLSTYAKGEYHFFAANTDPSLPQNYVSLVSAIVGLDNFTRVAREESPCSSPYCPQGIQAGYSVSSLLSAGYTGSGQKVAVVDLPGDPDPQTAIDTFDAQYGLPATSLSVIYPDGMPTSYDPGWASETALDIEAVHSVATGASIVLAYGASVSDDPMNLVDYVASNGLASVISNSWFYTCTSYCSDTQLPPTEVSSYDARLMVDVAQGVTILFASGDQGATPDGTHLGTEFPASDPNVLAVGATNLMLAGCGATTCTGYSSETGASISGGGYSGYFSEPAWQMSTIGSTASECTTGHLNPTCRAVPDVSMLGYTPGFWVYSTRSDECGVGPTPVAGWFSCTGTSLSTQLWGGFLAIAVQLNGGVGFGNIDPLVYMIASSGRYGSDFHDITSGSNGYSAAPGWDPVTGWGSPVGANLALDLAQYLSFALSNSGGITTNQGSSGSNEISVTLQSGLTKPVTLTCASGLPVRSSCSFNPQSATPDYTSTLVISTEPSTPTGTFTMTITGTGGFTTNSTSFNLVVNQQQQSCTQTSIPSTYNCPLSFVQGWNLFSLPVVPTANTTFPNTVDGIFGSNPQFGFMSNVTVVFAYTNGVWQSCTVRKQGSGANTKFTCVGTLKSLVDGKGYWVYTKSAFTLNNANDAFPTWGGLVGSVIPSLTSPPSYQLTAGWNLLGYKPQPDPTASESVASYLSSIGGSYDSVWVYSNGSWVRATGATSLTPGEAMWILMAAPATLRP